MENNVTKCFEPSNKDTMCLFFEKLEQKCGENSTLYTVTTSGQPPLTTTPKLPPKITTTQNYHIGSQRQHRYCAVLCAQHGVDELCVPSGPAFIIPPQQLICSWLSDSGYLGMVV
ncbi:hypothetical protein Fcan01_22051 [Folsomia candida]|uniref:Uncharacterized protein n=1 Tax=Folsomia candida TaxID=158441 RepID=A0A226DDP8_FOLCA|nr:hypothetical protein Fcan01_22051 [Folsomia candida]